MATLESMLAVELRRGMNTLGFRGGPWTYWRETSEAWHFVRAQRRSGPNLALPDTGAMDLSFTADIGVASRWLLSGEGIDPGRRPGRRDWHYDLRIGALMPAHHDYWWVLRPGDNETRLRAVVEDFIANVAAHGFRGFEMFGTDDALVARWAADETWLSPPERIWLSRLRTKATQDGSDGQDESRDEL